MSLEWKKEYKTYLEHIEKIKTVQNYRRDVLWKNPFMNWFVNKFVKIDMLHQSEPEGKELEIKTVAESLNEEEKRQKDPKYTLDKKTEATMKEFRKDWDGPLKSCVEKIDLGKMSTEERDYACATLAYQERLFGAFKIVNGYKERFKDIREKRDKDKVGWSITARPCSADHLAETSFASGLKFNSSLNFDKESRLAINTGWHQSIPAGMPMVAETASHEYGHVIDMAIACKLYDSFFKGEQNQPFDFMKYKKLYKLVALVRADIIKESVKKETGKKPKDTRLLENDKGMKKGISGYANSSPMEFNAESQPRATLCEDIPTDDVVARKTREFLDNGIEGMALQIGRRIKKQDLLGKYDSYYDKGLRKKKDVETFQISELAKLDGPNAKSSYTELYPLAINVHLKAAVSQIQKDCNEIQLSIPENVFDDLRKDFSAAKDKDGFKAAIEKFTKSAEQYGTMVMELDIGTDLQYILSIADKAFLNECERMLYKAASDDIARAKLDGLKSVLTSLDQLPSEEYQKRYEEARKGIRENSYMQALKKESEYHAAKDTDVLSLQKLYHETRQLQKANAQPNRQSMTVEQIMVNQINESNPQPITTSSQIPLTKSVNQKPVIKHGPKLG